jgi:hypothetical protein
MQYWGTFVFINGINPHFLKHVIKGESYWHYDSLDESPIVVGKPFISNTSLTEIGIPKSGGKKFSYSFSES